MKRYGLMILVMAGMLAGCAAGTSSRHPAIVPQPLKMTVDRGSYTLHSGDVIGVADSALLPAAEYLKKRLQAVAGLNVVVSADGNGNIILALADTVAGGKAGAYLLDVTGAGVRIAGSDYGGVMAGVASLQQLIPIGKERKSVPFVHIADAPRFAWRGMMLDVARHFYTKEEVMGWLDLMALYKLNKFHWHLTDDQGWRVEIRRYPLLTEKGAWRKYNSHDRSCLRMAQRQDNPDYNLPTDRLKVVEGDTLYGGFYTQDEIREVVAHATRLGIDVIPEIDMPGHSLCAISNYAGIACSDETGWGTTFSSPICPGKESATEFCRNVYREIFELFPYSYVHLGADEVEKDNWKKCPDCQRRMKANGLKSEEELHAWFVKDMEQFFHANGKKLIGWDEILEGGVSETARVMWWRSWAKRVVPEATALGNEVIVCPNAVCYFDAQQDCNTLTSVYNYEPIQPDLTAGQRALVVGVQANLWTEWIPSPERVEYMIMPRMLALSEVAWTAPENKDWNRFAAKLPEHFRRLDQLGISYRIPDLEGGYSSNAFIGSTSVAVSCPLPGVEIYYTTDGTIPTRESVRYTGPFAIDETTDVMFRTFRPDGSKGDYIRQKYIREEYSPAVKAEPKGEGVKVVWHDYRGESCRGIEDAPVKGEYIAGKVTIPLEVKGNIGLVITGYMNVPESGIYTFALLSDDGSVLTIDGQTVIDNDGPHSPKEVIGQKALAKGLHPFRVVYYDYNGGILELNMIDGKGNKVPLPEGWLKY